AESGVQERDMDVPEGAGGAAAERSGAVVERWRNLLETRFDAADGDGQEARRIGIDERRAGAEDEQAGGYAEPLAADAIDEIVEAGERREQADGEDGTGKRVAEAGNPHQDAAGAATAEPRGVGDAQAEKHRHQGSDGG